MAHASMSRNWRRHVHSQSGDHIKMPVCLTSGIASWSPGCFHDAPTKVHTDRSTSERIMRAIAELEDEDENWRRFFQSPSERSSSDISLWTSLSMQYRVRIVVLEKFSMHRFPDFALKTNLSQAPKILIIGNQLLLHYTRDVKGLVDSSGRQLKPLATTGYHHYVFRPGTHEMPWRFSGYSCSETKLSRRIRQPFALRYQGIRPSFPEFWA